ncbi:hypothetical protein QCA50_015460 [Cerrena zonata]|uniref:Malate dehydrogenase n=1 Tax=Cerrena zonata TaxID=2478898 RepID=A0AAW0FT09_9APHY
MVALPHALHTLWPAAAASTFWSWSWLHAANCDLTNQASSLVLPQTQIQLVAPTPNNLTLSSVGLAFGVQNYTCTQTNNFTNIGAVAELIDMSCLAGSSVFHDLPDQLYSSWVNFNHSSVQDIIGHLHMRNPPEILAQHYFITNPTTGQGLSPKWDFTSSGKFNGNSNAFFVGKGEGSLPSPNDPKQDINWLQVGNLQGKIADMVFRTDTRGGQPPSSCEFGKSPDISVKYVSYYFFFGGSIH